VIDLVNRRFVLFYFNVGKGQTGHDEEAAAFISAVDERFAGASVPTPPVWIFSPGEELLATIDNYTPKDEFFAALATVLDEHPELDLPTSREARILRGSDSLAAARVAEELGGYALAKKHYATAIATDAAAAHLGLARIARYDRDASAVEEELTWLEQNVGDDSPLASDVTMELAHLRLADQDYAGAREALVAAIKRWPDSPRMGEMHFYAGVAAFFLDERAWANFHWCWVMENIPGDYNYMRCYLAATSDAMPYPNPELGGHRGESNMISHQLADAARKRALADYRGLREEWEESP